MKLLIKYLQICFLMPLIFSGCIKDDQPDCPDEPFNVEEPFTVTVTPDSVQLSYEAHLPASEKLTVTCLNTKGLPVDTASWTLALKDANATWLQLTFDPAGLTGRGTSASRKGSQFVYLVAQENTTASKRVVELSIDNGKTVAVTVTQDIMPIEITPSLITLSGVPHIPAVQTVSVSSNGPWTLTSNQPWLLLSLNANGSQPLKTISSERSRTVYLVVEANSGNVRTAEIYLNNDAQDVRVTVIQESIIGEWGISDPRIFIFEINGEKKLLLTKDPTNYGAYFQFGSVIGWNWGDVVAGYNPTNNANLSSWNRIWNNGNKEVTHTHTELLLGRGDPCRLVGFTETEIRTSLAAGRTLDNSHWRLPNVAENIVFGLSSSEWTTINGIAGRVFASNGALGGSFLPAAGRIVPESATYGQKGNMGFYLCSSINNEFNTPYSLFFSQLQIDVSNYRESQSHGFSVRCVRQ